DAPQYGPARLHPNVCISYSPSRYSLPLSMIAEALHLIIELGKPKAGDIIVTRRGRVGDVAVVPNGTEFALGQNLVILRSDDSVVTQNFLRWALCGPFYSQQVDKYMNVGAVFYSLNCADIPKFEIPVPAKNEQERITHILGTLDDKIELNRRINETLEEMARAIFKSWFVDFDPVHAKAKGKKPAGMDAATAALFPSSFQDSPLGPIPKGWRVGLLDDICIISTENLNPSQFVGEIFDHYSIPSFDDGKKPVRELGSEIKSNKTVIHEKSILVSKLNPRIPRVWLPDISKEYRSICSTEFLNLLPKDGITGEYLYCHVSSDMFLRELATLVTGTSGSHQRVRPAAMLKMPYVHTTEQVIKAFTNKTRNIIELTQVKRRESCTLSITRDTLLPLLLSGTLNLEGVYSP
ncbi:MAG: restriction endonuclease subunit S, partial [Nitrospinota bacterium]|nr:restriction endonuclease subunit S [Nitrospinota bacterium]